MISRKDYLLTRPWQQRKYEHHRRKVQSALPAIDTNPPVNRSHVTVKLKKQQKEYERCKKIERDNFLLLQKMNYITRTSRVDNVWRTPQPKFLNKIAIYNSFVHNMELEDVIDYDFQTTDDERELGNRKSRCYACGSKKHEEIKIPENIQSRKLATRTRSKSVPARKTEPLPQIKEQEYVHKENSASIVSEDGKKSVSEISKLQHKYKGEIMTKEPHSIMITRGSLKLSVNFPSDTIVKFEKGNVKKLLMNGICHCKSSRKGIC